MTIGCRSFRKIFSPMPFLSLSPPVKCISPWIDQGVREYEGNTLRNPREHLLHADRNVSWLSPHSFLEVERESAGFWNVAIFRGRGRAASANRDESRQPFCSCS